MYREQFSIQKCILAIQLAENLEKKTLNLSNTIYSNLHPPLSPQQKEKKNQPPHLPLALVINYIQGFHITIFFHYSFFLHWTIYL